MADSDNRPVPSDEEMSEREKFAALDLFEIALQLKRFMRGELILECYTTGTIHTEYRFRER